jgi:hypothetical protein
VAILFGDSMVICDKDRLEWEGNEYLVRLYPSARGRIQVEVDLIEGGATIGIFARDYADNNPDSIHGATWSCIHEIIEICRS